MSREGPLLSGITRGDCQREEIIGILLDTHRRASARCSAGNNLVGKGSIQELLAHSATGI